MKQKALVMKRVIADVDEETEGDNAETEAEHVSTDHIIADKAEINMKQDM